MMTSILRRLLVLGIVLAAPLMEAHASNPIQVENAKPGATDWQLSNYASNHEIEGYASLTSVNRGGQIKFFVNTIDPNYTVEIFRTGWYGGAGARRITSAVQVPGVAQPTPTTDPVTGLIECAWTNPYVLNIPNDTADPTDWASGVYLAKLTGSKSGKQSYIVFVVRDDARPSDLLFQSSVNTYEAYNAWGGTSLYSSPVRAHKVSFNRPYIDSDGAGQYLFKNEYQMVRFLEREGYDVTYATDVDVHENSALLKSKKGVLIVGHGEYWTWQMRANILAARDSGVNLGIFGANTCYWQVRYEPSTVDGAADRTVVGYKGEALTQDPDYIGGNTSLYHLVTTLWRNAPVSLPEDAFIGVLYNSLVPAGDIIVNNASSWVFSGTGLTNGSHITNMLGDEGDSEGPDTPAGTVLLAHSPYPLSGNTQYSDMTVYTASSGATVFAAGTLAWSTGLDSFAGGTPNSAAQQITRNILAKFIGNQPPVANPGGPYTAAVSQSVQFDGRGSTAPSGTITAYKWDFGDGGSGTGAQPTHTYAAAGTFTVTLTVTDSNGNTNAAKTTATVAAATPSFSLSASNPSMTVHAGQGGTYNVILTPAGFSGAVAISCSGAPSGATCVPSPSSATLSGSTPVSVSVAVTTTAHSGAPLVKIYPQFKPASWIPALATIFAFLFGLAQFTGYKLKWSTAIVSLVLLLCLGCGTTRTNSTAATSLNPVPTTSGTPQGTYSLTFNATSGPTQNTLSLTLIVN